jgi:hypothetical protein
LFVSFLYQDLLIELIDIEDMKLVGDGLLLNDLGSSGLIKPTMKAEKEGDPSLFKPNGNGGEINLTLISEGATAGVEVGGEVSSHVAQRSNGVLNLAKGVLGGCFRRFVNEAFLMTVCIFYIFSSSSGVSCFIDITRHLFAIF